MAFATTLKTFGDLLRAKRLILDLSQPQLAVKLGISTERLGLLERNRSPPSTAERQKLAKPKVPSGGFAPVNPCRNTSRESAKNPSPNQASTALPILLGAY